MKCFWLWAGVELRHPHPEPGAGCAQVQKDKAPPEHRALPRACVNARIHLCDITLHLAGVGTGLLNFPASLRGSADGMRIEHSPLSIACPVGTRGGAPRLSPSCREQEELSLLCLSVCVLGCCSQSLLGQPLPVACTENFPTGGSQLPPAPLVSPRLPQGCPVPTPAVIS